MHLGMSGSFRVDGSALPRASRSRRLPHVVRRDRHVQRSAALRPHGPADAAAARRSSALSKLGPEPLSPAFDAAALARACRGKKTSLKAALLDQRVVAGLGNIYVSEALHMARLSPQRQASTIATASGAPRAAAVRLAAAIKRVLGKRWRGRRRRVPIGDRFRVYDRAGERCLRTDCSGSSRSGRRQAAPPTTAPYVSDELVVPNRVAPGSPIEAVEKLDLLPGSTRRSLRIQIVRRSLRSRG